MTVSRPDRCTGMCWRASDIKTSDRFNMQISPTTSDSGLVDAVGDLHGAGGNWATAGRGKMKRQRERGLSRVGMSGLMCNKRVSARMKGKG